MKEKELVLVLGGARSGKSIFAQRLAQQTGKKILFVATAEAKDQEMRARIRRHQADRPQEWSTVEEPVNLVRTLEENRQHAVVLVDCLTLWVSNLLGQQDERLTDTAKESIVLDALVQLLDAYKRGQTTLILVTNEVGMSVVPPSPLGRYFRDVLGRVNQLVASRADRVYLVVAGLAVELIALGAKRIFEEDDFA